MVQEIKASAPVETVPDVEEFRKLEKEALRLKKNAEKDYLELAECLARIRDEFGKAKSEKSSKKDLGHPSFEVWAETVLGWKRRKAMYILGIWDNMYVKAGISKKQIEEIEWSKAAELSRLAKDGKLTVKNVDKWAGRAASMNVPRLQEMVRAELKDEAAKPGVELLRSFVFRLYPDQAKNVEIALDVARELLQTDAAKLGHQLDMICLEFNASHQREREDREVAIHRLCTRIQDLFAVKLIVIDPKKSTVLFGKEEVQSLT